VERVVGNIDLVTEIYNKMCQAEKWGVGNEKWIKREKSFGNNKKLQGHALPSFII
jgi:hypothetical protein